MWNSPADNSINTFVDTKREDFLVAVLLADFVHDFKTGDDDEPVLGLDTTRDTRQNDVGDPLAGFFEDDLVGDVAEGVEAELVEVAPARSHAQQHETEETLVPSEHSRVLRRETQVPKYRGDLQDPLAVGILRSQSSTDAEQLLVLVLELYWVLVLVTTIVHVQHDIVQPRTVWQALQNYSN